jgi:hypothetical protein
MINKSILLALTFSAAASANISDTSEVSFNTGDVVHIQSCDKWGWCKLKDNSGFVKGHNFARYPKDESIAIKDTKGITYLYYIRPIYKDDTPVFEFIKTLNVQEEIDFAKNNYQYGYIREKDLKAYKLYMSNYKKQKSQSILDNKSDIKELKLKDDNNEVVSDDKKRETKTEVNDTQNSSSSKYFVYAALGASSVSGQDDNYGLVGFGAGYNYSKNYFATAGLQHSVSSQTDITNLIASVNYSFDDIYLKPYLGLTGGYSQLKWKKDPISNASQKDETASKFFVGVQVGIEHKLNDDFSLYGAYQHNLLNHTTNIQTTSSYDINHKTQNNFLIGVKYDIK